MTTPTRENDCIYRPSHYTRKFIGLLYEGTAYTFSFLVGFHLESNVYGEGKISRLALDFRSKLPLSFAEHSDTFRSTNHRRAAIEIGVFHQIGKGCQLHSNATK